MSLIETPPRDRLSIQTQVVQFSENVIKSAIELELGRGGQVFYTQPRGDHRDHSRSRTTVGSAGTNRCGSREDE